MDLASSREFYQVSYINCECFNAYQLQIFIAKKHIQYAFIHTHVPHPPYLLRNFCTFQASVIK